MNLFRINFLESQISHLEEMLDYIREMDSPPNHQLIFEVEKELEELQHELDSVEVFYESSLGDDPI